MFTVWFWKTKGEMRVVNLHPNGGWLDSLHSEEFEPVAEDPRFHTVEEGWAWIARNYPQYHP